MKSLERRFINISEKYPLWSSHTCFAEAVVYQRFSRSIIHRWFSKLVQRDDYARNEKRAILEHLENLTNLPRNAEIKKKNHRHKA